MTRGHKGSSQKPACYVFILMKSWGERLWAEADAGAVGLAWGRSAILHTTCSLFDVSPLSTVSGAGCKSWNPASWTKTGTALFSSGQLSVFVAKAAKGGSRVELGCGTKNFKKTSHQTKSQKNKQKTSPPRKQTKNPNTSWMKMIFVLFLFCI